MMGMARLMRIAGSPGGAGLVECVRIGSPVPLAWGGLAWHVATVRAGCDGRARDELEAAGLPVFMLEGRRPVRLGNRRKPVMRNHPVFPGYLFVGDIASTLQWLARRRVVAVRDAMAVDTHRVLDASGVEVPEGLSDARMVRGMARPLVTGFVGMREACGIPRITRVNGAAMQDLFIVHESGMFAPGSVRDDLRKRIRAGDAVRILDGGFADLRGIVEKFHRGETIEILADFFGRRTRVTIPLDSVGVIEV